MGAPQEVVIFNYYAENIKHPKNRNSTLDPWVSLAWNKNSKIIILFCQGNFTFKTNSNWWFVTMLLEE